MSEAQSTTNYKQFKSQLGNRDINRPHVVRLIKSVKRRNLLDKFPILVDENMTVIDGQTRLAVAAALEVPIFYVQEKDLDLEDTREVNSASRAWGIRDFIKSFAETGKKDYQELLNFMEEHELSPTNSAHLLYGNAGTSGTHGGSISTVVKEGRFKVNEPKKAAVIAQQLRALQKYSEFKTTSDRDLLRALWLLLDEADFDFEVFLYKLDKHEQRLVKKNSTKYYLLEIEDVYNYSTTAENKVNLYKGQV